MDSEEKMDEEPQPQGGKVAAAASGTADKPKPIGIAEPTKSSPSTSTSSRKTGIDDDELDALLNDALLDFDKPVPKAKVKPPAGPTIRGSSGEGAERVSPVAGSDDMNQIWSEEFIKEATAQFEKKMREYVNQSNPTTAAQSTANLNKVVEAATKAAIGQGDPGLAATFNEAIKNISANPEAAAAIGASGGWGEEADLSKLMGSLGMGDFSGLDGEDSEMDQLLPFMTNMMQKLLSKDLLQPVLTDIVDRYPDWLADNRPKLATSEFDKYNQQYEHMRKICEEYAKEKETDSEDVKQKRFDLISELMLKVQFAGPPPKELVGELEGSDESGMPKLDPALASQCTIA